jgi:threonine-phosphate decarboxylase
MYQGHGGDLTSVQDQFGLRKEEILDFSTNVNPLGVPGNGLKAFRNSWAEIGSYPDPYCRALRRKASIRYGLPENNILAGNGTTEFIFLIPRAFQLKSAIIFCPTYQDYEEAARMAGYPVQRAFLNLTPGIQDLHAVLSGLTGGSHLVFLCNPNNPTGSYFPAEDVRWLIKTHPGLLFVVDEAYADFIAGENISLLKFPLEKNVIVLRSLTKIFSIPGLRLGLAFASEEIIQKLNDAKEPWTVNTPAQRAGETLLDEKSFVEKTGRFVQKNRERFMKKLEPVKGFYPLPSAVNFFLVRLGEGLSAGRLKDQLLEKKILIRSGGDIKGLGPEYIRLAVKKKIDQEALISALNGRGS